MDGKKILFIMAVLTLFVGCAFAANSVNDFKVNDAYKHVSGNDYFSLNMNDNRDVGITVYKNANDDAYGDVDVYDHVLHDDGREYIQVDDDMKIVKNSDNSANFTDFDHATHGVVELVESNGQQFIVVAWAKDSSNVQNAELAQQIAQFNNDNQVKAIAF
ncbi:hypothetical protein [Methanobrevibacter sp.]|uniref:hypothetical protein n=1 Tax=Methanobrevibacter sp. TaxID=66852 RepID=UPI00388F5A40